MGTINLQCSETALSPLCSVNWSVDALDLTLNGWSDINWKLPANGHFTELYWPDVTKYPQGISWSCIGTNYML